MTERKSIKDLIAKDGYEVALLTTYTFDISFFERSILNTLLAHNIKTISVFADSKQFTKALSNVNYSRIGSRYLVNPVDIQSSFHPKVILLLGQQKARLVVSSANLTTSGYNISNEIYNYVDYSESNPENLDVIVSAIQFFIMLNKHSYQLDNDVIKQIRDYSYYRKAPENGKIQLLHNLEESLLDQVKKRIEETVTEVKIAVPYYDSSLVALKRIIESFYDAKVSLYVQNALSTFPVEFNDSERVASDVNVFEKFVDNKSNRFYHGKVFLFKTHDKAYTLFGSANCTQAALTNSFKNGGNIECDFFVKGEYGDFDYYFDNFALTDSPLTASSPNYNSPATQIYFKYGKLDKDLYLYFGCQSTPDIYIGEVKLACKRESGDLIATVPNGVLQELPAFFYVQTRGDVEDEIKCWWYNPDYLNSFRTISSSMNTLVSFELESETDKYLQDRVNLFNAEQSCWEDINNAAKAEVFYTQSRLVEEDRADVDDDDYYVQYQIPEEYNPTLKTYNELTRIRQLFISRTMGFYAPVFTSQARRITEGTDLVVEDEITYETRKPTSEEKSFERFIKRKIKALTQVDNKNIDNIKPMHLLGLVLEYLEVFDKYKHVELFEPLYVVETRLKLIQLLMKKDFSEETEETRYVILLETYKALVNNYYLSMREPKINEKEKYNIVNKDIVDLMNKSYGIRTTFRGHIEDLLKSEERVLKAAYVSEITKYIEGLFGYMDYDSLIAFISKRYNCEEIRFDGTSVTITALTDVLRKPYLPDSEVLKEIKRYSRYCAKVDYVTIIVKCLSDQYKKSITYKNDLSHNYSEQVIVFKNGNVIIDTSDKIYYSN